MPEACARVTSFFSTRKKKRLPRIGMRKITTSQSEEESCIVVILDNGEERCISRNVSNLGIQLAERIRAGSI